MLGRKDSTNPSAIDGREGSADPFKRADLGDNTNDADLPSGKNRIKIQLNLN